MYYKLVCLKSNLVINFNYYQENKFGVNMVKAQINITYSPLVVIVYVDKKIIHSHIVCLLNGRYEMQ
jgi:hypothetical protein